MGAFARRCLALLAVFALCFETAHSVRCYRCISTNNTHPFQCNEFLSSDYDIQPESCDDIHQAKYCIKHVGRFEALTLDCYQCASADNWMCENGDLVSSSLRPHNCSYVFEAAYCIKTIGRYGGGIGTKRFCSAVHMGNYCDYVKQNGDQLNYRTCVYTCSGNGCNPAAAVLPSRIIQIFVPTAVITIFTSLIRR